MVASQLKLLIQSGNPLISVSTTDEVRAVELVEDVASELSRKYCEWSLTTGLLEAGEERATLPQRLSNTDPKSTLLHIREQAAGEIFVFRDLGPYCKDAMIHRLLRDLIRVCDKAGSTLVMIDALPLPDEIRRFTVKFEIGWPDAKELRQVVTRTFKTIKRDSLQEVRAKLTSVQLDQIVQTLRGLSRDEAERVVASAIYDDYTLTSQDIPRIVEAKRTLLGSAGCLESIAADFDVEDIGGLQNLKGWLKQRRGGFSKEAREFGIESPRGILMLGVPGCGKSLCAKAVAADWHMPLLRLDPGVLYQKFIGESESQLRQALAQAEAMAPAVLWIDEIEKAFASAAAGSADGGLSKRMFGTLLSWMQDHRHPIFIVATANDLSALPPELMRKGRFDEVFFVDLPNEDARQQVFDIHLRRRSRDPENFDLEQLARNSLDFSGSEIEQAVVSALYNAFSKKQKLATKHIVEELSKTRPLSGLMSERIAELREWSENRCVPAD